LLSCLSLFAQNSSQNSDWPIVGRDPGDTRHSPLTQIDRKNVSQLKVAWTFDTEDWSDGLTQSSRSAF
jgi:quinoprotein glucose dehydrogenase